MKSTDFQLPCVIGVLDGMSVKDCSRSLSALLGKRVIADDVSVNVNAAIAEALIKNPKDEPMMKCHRFVLLREDDEISDERRAILVQRFVEKVLGITELMVERVELIRK